ncbi:conserved domain protein [delta proteobacterium NaphS2]|nr:conserved domain protein [delta proteobacterium NaphS2]
MLGRLLKPFPMSIIQKAIHLREQTLKAWVNKVENQAAKLKKEIEP